VKDKARTSIQKLPAKYNRDAYNQIFKEYYPRLLAYGELFLDTQEAEDIVQDVLVYIWENSESIEIHTSLEKYLFKAVFRRCLNQIKHHQIRKDHNQSVIKELLDFETQYFDPDQNDSIQKVFSTEIREEIDKALVSLTSKCREAFMLSYIHEMKTKEIALEMLISERTVETHVYNALKILRTKLKKIHFLSFWFY